MRFRPGSKIFIFSPFERILSVLLRPRRCAFVGEVSRAWTVTHREESRDARPPGDSELARRWSERSAASERKPVARRGRVSEAGRKLRAIACLRWWGRGRALRPAGRGACVPPTAGRLYVGGVLEGGDGARAFRRTGGGCGSGDARDRGGSVLPDKAMVSESLAGQHALRSRDVGPSRSAGAKRHRSRGRRGPGLAPEGYGGEERQKGTRS